MWYLGNCSPINCDIIIHSALVTDKGLNKSPDETQYVIFGQSKLGGTKLKLYDINTQKIS